VEINQKLSFLKTGTMRKIICCNELRAANLTTRYSQEYHYGVRGSVNAAAHANSAFSKAATDLELTVSQRALKALVA
jgi:hypothetical protein